MAPMKSRVEYTRKYKHFCISRVPRCREIFESIMTRYLPAESTNNKQCCYTAVSVWRMTCSYFQCRCFADLAGEANHRKVRDVEKLKREAKGDISKERARFSVLPKGTSRSAIFLTEWLKGYYTTCSYVTNEVPCHWSSLQGTSTWNRITDASSNFRSTILYQFHL